MSLILFDTVEHLHFFVFTCKSIFQEKEQPIRNRPIDIAMTGKERRNHEEWKQERDRCDQERIRRSQNNEGSWKRAWDVEKIPDESVAFIIV